MPAVAQNRQGRTYIPKPDDRDPTTFQSRRFGDRTYRFGRWHGERDEKNPLYREYQQAILSAETLHENATVLQQDENLTEQGKSAALQNDAMPLLTARLKFHATTAVRRATLQEKATATLALTLKGYDTNTGAHDRLIEAYRNLPAEQKARMFAETSFLSENRELGIAVLAEPQIVTGIDDDQRQYLQQALLTDDQRTTLQAIDLEVQQLAAVEKAYDTARLAAADLCGVQEAHINALEDTIDVKAPPTNDKDKPPSLADGGVLQLADITDDEEDEDEDSTQTD